MFASASQLAKPVKRAAESAAEAQRSSSSASSSSASWRSALQPDASSAAPWKRVKTEPTAAVAMTQPTAQHPQQQKQQTHRTMLGAWFGAARAAASQQLSAATQQLPVQRQPSAFARVKTEVTSLSQDSEDDRPLARFTVTRPLQQQQQQQQQDQAHPRDWKQQKELQRLQAKARSTTPPPHVKAGFKTARGVTREAPAAATASPSSSASAARVASGDDERVFQLSTKRRITVRRWKSTALVDIREYYDDNGVSKPGKKGISLAKDQWNTLMRMARVIDEAVGLVEDDRVDGRSMGHVKEHIPVNEERTLAFTLSSKRRITVRFFRAAVLIDLREYYEQGSEMKPGKKGISLSKDQWRSLQQTEAEISQALEEL